ncbi:MAG: insulinase family protein [Candidatus Marinimicrobia bacterium]|nr:insulinase family protein [Candidatus Neomarinimicrobiota bacterium]
MQLSKQVVVGSPTEGITTLIMPTTVKDVITFAGSFLGGALYSPKTNRKIAPITAAMLDKGTQLKSKYEISNLLEDVGAEVNFSATQHHVQFTGFCLKENLTIVIQLLGEQLRSPAFSSKELATLKTRTIGMLDQSKEDTKKQALIGFLRNLYPEYHPNYRTTIEEAIKQTKKVSKKEIKSFHEKHYGLSQFNFAAVGDVNPTLMNDLLEDQFNGWENKNITTKNLILRAHPSKEMEQEIHIADKTSLDMYLGQPIGIDREHEDYYALMMGIYILGGNFSARLMQTVRDNQGLTYGIGSSLAGTSFGSDGYWSTWGTFAPNLLETGKKATTDQIENWYKKGVTSDELKAKKTTMTGSYQVGMDSTGGIVAQLLSNAERGRSVEHLDQYPEIIKGISLDHVNRAIKQYIDPKKLTLVTAGSFN